MNPEEMIHTRFKLKMGAIEPSADAQRVTPIADVLTQKASVRFDLDAAWDERHRHQMATRPAGGRGGTHREYLNRGRLHAGPGGRPRAKRRVRQRRRWQP
jgi:hypothetical protein